MHVVTIMGSLLSIDSQTVESQTAELHNVQRELELARKELKKAEEVSDALHDVRIKLRLALEKQKKKLTSLMRRLWSLRLSGAKMSI